MRGRGSCKAQQRVPKRKRCAASPLAHRCRLRVTVANACAGARLPAAFLRDAVRAACTALTRVLSAHRWPKWIGGTSLKRGADCTIVSFVLCGPVRVAIADVRHDAVAARGCVKTAAAAWDPVDGCSGVCQEHGCRLQLGIAMACTVREQTRHTPNQRNVKQTAHK